MEAHDPDFWNHHSLHYLEMAFEAGNMEAVENPDGFGKRTGDCGDTVNFYIQVEDRCLKQVSFTVEGCMNTVACSNTVVKLTRGKSLDAAWEITADQVIEFLETLPADHEHCAELSVGAFYRALTDFQNKNQP
ncbi:MAG: iron-sulfur cluster assembly scaffold protein [Desulfobacterales bacterium]|nr:iron-sulfur cluster assembly scaffold protein [Desulfobacterales bacterium]